VGQSFFRHDFRSDETIPDEFFLQEQTGRREPCTSGTIIKDAGDDDPWRKRPAFPLQFAQKSKNSFTSNQVELYIAPGAGHSDSSKTPGYQPAVKLFLDRFMKTEICK